MKQSLLGVLAIVLLLLGACNKKDSPYPAGNTWKLGNQTYVVNNVFRNTKDRLNAITDANTAQAITLEFRFSSFPATTTSYTVAHGLPFIMVPGEVAITIYDRNELLYYSSPFNTAKATVIVNGSTNTILLPEVWMYAITGDSVLLSAHISE